MGADGHGMNGRCQMREEPKAVTQTRQFLGMAQRGASVKEGKRKERRKVTISRSSRAVSRASSSSDASCALERASFISSESGLPSIASMILGSRSVLRVGGGGDDAASLPVPVVEFSMLQRRRLCML